jgi:hypothetical protein
MHRAQIYLPDDLYSQLQAKARSTGLNISEIIRQAIRRELTHQPNAAEVFFASHLPLKSFAKVEPTEYLKQLRQNSRILQNNGEVDE